MSGRLLTARDVAGWLSVSVETVLRWHRRGDLPGVRLASNVLRFEELELELWLERRKGQGQAPPSARALAGADSTAGPEPTAGADLLPFASGANPEPLHFDSNPPSSSRRETANTIEESHE